jgi:hypothetical protein
MSGQHHTGEFEKKLRALCEGFRRDFTPSQETVNFGGRPLTVAEVLASLQAIEDTFESVHQAHRAYRQAVSERRRAMKRHRSVYEDAVVFLKHHLGKESPRLTSFGVALHKERRPLSAEANALSRAKAAATRKARGTLGKRQRLALARPPERVPQVLGPDGQPLSPGAEVPPGGKSKEPGEPEP